MRWIQSFILIMTVQTVWAQEDLNSRREELYHICQTKISEMNFGSVRWETICSEQFDMPGPYLIKCATWVANRQFPTEVDKRACRFFCSRNDNWGPWYDFEIPYQLKEVILEMKRIQAHGRCFEGEAPQVARGF
jgi:hypothetical protein